MNSEYVNASKKCLRDDRHAARLRPKIASSSLVSLRILFPSLAARGEVPRSAPYAVRKPQAYNAAPFPMASRSMSEVSTDEHINEAVFGRDGRVRVTAAPLWMRVVIDPAALRCQDAFPGVALTGIIGPILEADRVSRASNGTGRIGSLPAADRSQAAMSRALSGRDHR